MESRRIFARLLLLLLLTGCGVSNSSIASEVPTPTLPNTPTPTVSPTITPSPTSTSTPEPTSTETPQTVIFYGDSLLKIGDTSNPGAVGFSIVDVLRPKLPPTDKIIIENNGGRNAKWGYENLKTIILPAHPDIVTLWWGMNDLGGCPGIFDQNTNKLLQYKLDAMLNLYLMYTSFQIRDLVAAGASIIVVTPIPVLGTLNWSHFDENNVLVWDVDRHCDFNQGLEQLVEALRVLVSNYQAKQDPVFLVDAWKIYKGHPDSGNMYMDNVHPGSYGAELIARDWMKAYESIEK